MQEWSRRAALVAGAAGAAAVAGLAAAPAWGQAGGDVALLRRAYTAMHPGLLRYATAEETSARFDGLERAFDAAPDRRARYLALSRFLATVRCGHTYANFYNQSDAVQAELFAGRDRLPFQFLWLGPRMIVTADPAGVGLPRGTEVEAIDGRPARDILAALMTVARADGANDAKRRRLMSVQGEDAYESFDVFHPLLFGGRDRYRLRLRLPDGRRSERTVEAIDLPARRAQRKAAPASALEGWSFERRGDVAVLTMPSWSTYSSKADWRAWIAARFEEMARANVRGLVVDLRANEGGEDCGDEILSRLVDAPIQARTARRLVRYRHAPDDLRPALDTWDKSFLDWGDAARPFDDRFFELAQKEDDGRGVGEVRPAGPRFGGRVAVLIGPQNSSATFQFADTVRRERLGVLVGEETGGSQRGINGGAFFFLRLPQSGLEADLPVIGTFPREPRPDRGLTPDAPVAPTPETIAAGADPALDRALALARG